MAETAVETLLEKSFGLDAGTIGRDSVERAVKRRMKELGLVDGNAYSECLHGSADEVAALVEEVVVPESWFFRNEEAFRVLQRFLVKEWRPAHPGCVVRVLSLPCSTGEEPYSIAMALMDAGLGPEQFHIDATDVSRRALARARLGVYGNNSFRGNSRAICGRHFHQTKTGFALQESVREAVLFHHGNVLDRNFMKGLGSYDVIFCRNLLIYLSQEARRGTARLMAGMLRDDGMLFVGHAEGGLTWKGLVTSARYPMAFAFRKFNDDRRAEGPGQRPKPAAGLPEPKQRMRPAPVERRRAPVAHNRRQEAAPKKTPPPSEAGQAPGLETAGELANSGRLKEAASLCEAWMRENGPSARAYFILGLIRGTEGDGAGADDCFRKALYLEPDHYEALVHLALLKEQQGDSVAALLLKRRTRRVYEKAAAAGEKSGDGRG
ncbi:MAG: CheR family methyltransferase [Dehalococcoidia bacterium]